MDDDHDHGLQQASRPKWLNRVSGQPPAFVRTARANRSSQSDYHLREVAMLSPHTAEIFEPW
ncbi:hypothetical protein AAP_05466 [Ascosphaera apis ARSEF 7405]|uniref:Uncharacterized protein n=1 Tax=Ascosphaera apis ARSEF 7405 TaxID=392613 RepID=A0A162IE58_9EURO|nr:hypothetical protein AAP_05466 [Ascosphaera apis ARSEF 7405]